MTLTEMDVLITQHCSKVTVQAIRREWIADVQINGGGRLRFLGPSPYNVLSALCAQLRKLGGNERTRSLG